MDSMMKEFLKKVKTNPVVLGLIPSKMGMGLPTVSIRNETVCVNIPFFAERFAQDDQTLIYPFSYVVTALWGSGRIVGFFHTPYSGAFETIQVDRPVGTFRHDAIKHLDKAGYTAHKDALYAGYDTLIRALTSDAPYSEEDSRAFIQLLNLLLEPSLKQFYRIMDADFCNRFFEER